MNNNIENTCDPFFWYFVETTVGAFYVLLNEKKIPFKTG